MDSLEIDRVSSFGTYQADGPEVLPCSLLCMTPGCTFDHEAGGFGTDCAAVQYTSVSWRPSFGYSSVTPHPSLTYSVLRIQQSPAGNHICWGDPGPPGNCGGNKMFSKAFKLRSEPCHL